MIPYLLGLAMAATLIVLFAGVISFAFGKQGDRSMGTKLMVARVVLQGAAIVLLGVMVFLSFK